MCGIIGYLSNEDKDIVPILIAGLKRLEYRGYDSCGIVVCNSKSETLIEKSTARVKKLEEKAKNHPFPANMGIGHTRWATHGLVTEKNAHPHCDCKREIFLVHNGIIENYKTIKEKLKKKGHNFISETDTEALAHLIEHFFKDNLEDAVKKALKLVKGTYGLAVISSRDPKKIVIAKNASPLVFSINDGGEVLVASDATSILNFSRKVIFLEDKEIAVLTSKGFKVFDMESDRLKTKEFQELDWTIEKAEKSGYSHFMLKEICEEPEAIRNSIRGRIIAEDGLAKLGGLEKVQDKLREIEKLFLVSCGTASYAAEVGKYMLEEYAGISTETDIASEFRYRKPILTKKTAFLAVSQSGETADTLAALNEAKRKGILTLGIVNVVGSSVARQTDAGIYNHVGPENAVASTKAFLSQLSIMVLLTVFLGRQRDMSLVMGKRILGELEKIPDLMKEILKESEKIKEIAVKYSRYRNFIFLGRKYNAPIAKEGALKLKEIAYFIHAEGYPAGEMKHGPIALADKNFPFFFIAPSDSVYEKTISNMEEIKARNAPIIAIATKGNEEIKNIADDVIYIPKTLEMLTPMLTSLPLHLFAYYAGVKLNCDVDRPRNLAKSVTVE
ncbi:glutamine--fructose-6-phosphate transaminase (isomerizing) [Patescibacteria group bacterium]|nr:glutamine--fructose-6-phosphate transaminase (isomerizing) [Patescibacteria group bacterium]MBU4580732.1 glutamine--fructose-6-phosphate transaminase (isomerizing) [Patescibacteria group bacterium]